jgi:hypothetical protein
MQGFWKKECLEVRNVMDEGWNTLLSLRSLYSQRYALVLEQVFFVEDLNPGAQRHIRRNPMLRLFK